VSTRRVAVLALACAIAGCAAPPGGRTAIQDRYDAIAAAVRAGDAARVRALWTADPKAEGSPLAALDRTATAGGHMTDWTSTIHRFRMVGDTAVVDAGVRFIVENGGAATVTTRVVRAFWVHTAGGWTVVRTEPLGAADVRGSGESAAR
jgi:hypothetical protein